MTYIITGLVKNYKGRRVLDIPRMDIVEGELLAIVGPSGAGKSTLLRLLHFLEEPSSGLIAYSHGVRKTVTSDFLIDLSARREIGMVFQRPETVYGTVKDNVALGLRFRKQHDERKVLFAMEQVDISHLADANVSELSGGELQRVALARVLAIEPKVVLFDEPTANLDPANVFLVERIVRQLNNSGCTIVLVTHNVFQARRLADRVAFLLDGKLVELSDAEKFFGEPDDDRSRAFVQGEMIY